MISKPAAILLGLILAAGCGPAFADDGDCGGSPCAGGPWLSLAGNWRFVSSIAQWSVAVDDSGRFHAEGPRSVTIGGEQASYISTLAGTISHDHVALSIKADNFSLPNFVPGPATICTGVPAGAGRYEGSCANGKQRLGFVFIREGAATP